MRERRAHSRRPVSKKGLLTFDDNRSIRACKLVNISEGGTLVRVSDPQQLPDLVSLYYDMLDEQKLEVVVAWCMVVRRGVQEVALRFLHSDEIQGLTLKDANLGLAGAGSRI